MQAALLAEAITETRRSDLLADAYQKAWARGEAWQEAIVTALMLMPDNGKKALADALGVKVDSLGKAWELTIGLAVYIWLLDNTHRISFIVPNRDAMT
ncbi:hypothetical protein DSM25559_5441 [Agrobacterium rosae]|uniref:Uncharacterized protein n=1 Tax=Agrobacterium rosae TaxID=1972867 RepID=A0A1R3U3J9_9HYPH|nr:hypothetical protein DSM25559_5441 [Agrobacterium rosae]